MIFNIYFLYLTASAVPQTEKSRNHIILFIKIICSIYIHLSNTRISNYLL